MNQQSTFVDPTLVEKLSTPLEQAKQGELTGFVAVSFREGGAVDRWGHLPRREDITRAPVQVEALRQVMTAGSTTASAPGSPAT